jgi:hypothetical protein
MSLHVAQVYERAKRSPIDSDRLQWDDLFVSAFKLQQNWGDDFAAAGAALMLSGLARTRIINDGKWWRLPDLGEPNARGAWVMPIYEGDDLIELVAFAAGGKIGPWFLVGGVDGIGLEYPREDKKLVIFTQPYEWIMYWLKQCRQNPAWLSAPETQPWAFAALVLDRDRIDWRPYRIEPAGVTAGFEEVYCADDPTLAELIIRAAKPPTPNPLLVTRRRQPPKEAA